MPLPKYPNTKLLEISDKKPIEAITRRYAPYSDFNFTSLWAWDVNDDSEVSLLNNNLVIKFSDYVTGRKFFTFIGKQRLAATISRLCEDAARQKINRRLQLIPEDVAKAIDNKQAYIVRADRDNHDYIIDLRDFTSLEGKSYRNIRHEINKFKKQYGKETIFKRIDLSKAPTKAEILKLFEIWGKNSSQTESEINNEYIALKRLLSHSNKLSLLGYGLYLRDKMMGFSIYEKLADGYGIGHFEKTDNSFGGASAYIKLNAAKELIKSGVYLFNEEQDLGLPGLRRSKLLHRPKKFLRKYFISLRK